jgi:hypothetical protein
LRACVWTAELIDAFSCCMFVRSSYFLQGMCMACEAGRCT